MFVSLNPQLRSEVKREEATNTYPSAPRTLSVDWMKILSNICDYCSHSLTEHGYANVNNLPKGIVLAAHLAMETVAFCITQQPSDDTFYLANRVPKLAILIAISQASF